MSPEGPVMLINGVCIEQFILSLCNFEILKEICWKPYLYPVKCPLEIFKKDIKNLTTDQPNFEFHVKGYKKFILLG